MCVCVCVDCRLYRCPCDVAHTQQGVDKFCHRGCAVATSDTVTVSDMDWSEHDHVETPISHKNAIVPGKLLPFFYVYPRIVCVIEAGGYSSSFCVCVKRKAELLILFQLLQSVTGTVYANLKPSINISYCFTSLAKLNTFIFLIVMCRL